jgi:ElaB/YqjD/DUF883 family membrane-anchored ribosome-binding protein
MRHKTGNGHQVDLERFIDDIKTVVRDGEELLRIGAVKVKERAQAGAQITDRTIRSHTYETIGIIFGIGMIAGMILSATSSRTPEE